MDDVETLEAPEVATEENLTDEQKKALEPVFQYEVDGMDEPLEIDLNKLPKWLRFQLLKKQIISTIDNRISTAEAKTKKDNAEWTLYENAGGNLQTDIPEPTTEKAVTAFKDIAERARQAFYDGELGRRGGGEASAKAARDPLTTIITRVVVNEVYQKNRAADPKYKYFSAQKEVGPDGLAYLKAKIADKVAAGGDEAALNKTLETRYVKKAREMLGMDKVKGAESSLID